MKIPSEGIESHKHKGCRNEIPLTAVNVFVGVDKFRGKDGNWRETILRVDEDIHVPKVAVSYTMQEDNTERSKVKFERERELVDGPMA
jgi:hypothetical protein